MKELNKNREFYYKKSKLLKRFFSSSYYLILFPIFLSNDFSLKYQIYLSIFVLLAIFHIYRFIKDYNRKEIFSYNENGVSYVSFKTTISWDEISDIDLNYERFLTTHLLLFCKNEYPWYKKYFSTFKIEEKSERIDIGLINCNPEKVYHEMYEYLAQYKSIEEE